MRMKSVLLSFAALSMAGAPVAASAAPMTSLASSTSRVATPTAESSDLSGGQGAGGLFAIALLAGIIAIVVIAAVNGDDDDNGNGNGNLPTSP